jgi:four helix bundle protein
MKNGRKRKRSGVRESSVEYAVTALREKEFDLEERKFVFAKNVRAFVKKLPRTICNVEDVKQLARASGSVGATYIEANEALGTKDFLYKIKCSRREAKECRFFLRLLDLGGNSVLNAERDALAQEAEELTKIFGAIYRKSTELPQTGGTRSVASDAPTRARRSVPLHGAQFRRLFTKWGSSGKSK